MDASVPDHQLQRRRRAILAFLLSAVAVCSLLLLSSTEEDDQYSSFLRTNSNHQDRLLAQVSRVIDSKFALLDEPVTLNIRTSRPGETPYEQYLADDEESRKRCQVVYILGVEGAAHHGIIPIIEALAKVQHDENGIEYHVNGNPQALKAGLFGWFGGIISRMGFRLDEPMTNPAFVKQVVDESCPNDGKKHVLIEWASFPSGQEDDTRSYRVHRQHDWLTMTPEEIASSGEAMNHPTNMANFVKAYSPLMDIKFVVLHRPFLETIASHPDWDGGAETHSNIIRGYMILLRKFLDKYKLDSVSGERLWNLLCVEHIMSKNYEKEEDVASARTNVLANLASFLGWSNSDCPNCFDSWNESTKDPKTELGEEKSAMLKEHMKLLQGVWPPPGEEGVAEQQCGL